MHELQLWRVKMEFSSEAVCHDGYLLVTVHCGLSHPFYPPLTKNGDFSHFKVLTFGKFPGV